MGGGGHLLNVFCEVSPGRWRQDYKRDAGTWLGSLCCPRADFTHHPLSTAMAERHSAPPFSCGPGPTTSVLGSPNSLRFISMTMNRACLLCQAGGEHVFIFTWPRAHGTTG